MRRAKERGSQNSPARDLALVQVAQEAHRKAVAEAHRRYIAALLVGWVLLVDRIVAGRVEVEHMHCIVVVAADLELLGRLYIVAVVVAEDSLALQQSKCLLASTPKHCKQSWGLVHLEIHKPLMLVPVDVRRCFVVGALIE